MGDISSQKSGGVVMAKGREWAVGLRKRVVIGYLSSTVVKRANSSRLNSIKGRLIEKLPSDVTGLKD